VTNNLQQPDQVNGAVCILSNELASPLREAIEALTALGACLTAITHSIPESQGLDRGQLQDALTRCLGQQRRATDAVRALRRLGDQTMPEHAD
jgi:hypothetical protein